jgi:hypothetical protein
MLFEHLQAMGFFVFVFVFGGGVNLRKNLRDLLDFPFLLFL